ncbi:MAG: beta-ketoacyl synthase [Gammaproteobacteria bacterium]|nr:beta-ketoacyl synthase [Gammaproteobacteria bacterium]
MRPIAVIAGFGGINAAGRTSGHHGYRRTILDALPAQAADETIRALAGLMGIAGEIDATQRARILEGTLVRGIEPSYFDPTSVGWNCRARVSPGQGDISFEIAQRDLPQPLPDGWTMAHAAGGRVRITIPAGADVLLPVNRALDVSAAGQVPSGFDPKSLYPGRGHPRAVQLALFAANDALGSLGIGWHKLMQHVAPDRISVYAGSAMGQLDQEATGGLLGSRYRGMRPTSKQVPMGLAEMPADFVNAYVLGSVGQTGHNMGACATFLYNLRHGMFDIESGRSRVALGGGAEAPLCPDVIEGLSTMGALGTDEGLLELDRNAGRTEPDLRRACRPFAENCGFTIAEGSQFVVLLDDTLAVELGATIHGAVTDVLVHADGYKKSISSPGIGNYITVAKAVARARRMFGEESIRRRSFVQAHGTGTPHNRTTESRILNGVAAAFGMENWPVAAIKCFVGHTMAAAGGDQLASSLGVFEHGVLPGIATIDEVAADVARDHLRLAPQPLRRAPADWDVSFLNSKGFGGNNATATIAAPHVVTKWLERRHGIAAIGGWRKHNDAVVERAARWDRAMTEGTARIVYRFDHEVRSEEHVTIEDETMHIAGLPPISLVD